MKIAEVISYALAARLVVAFSFRLRVDKEAVTTGPRHDPALNSNLSDMLKSGSQTSVIYSTALNELQDLESEPLCHRIAARLLLGNCQLLDGKDEATILTDSGRQIRDFVDAYAASMAICDLERGRFHIPSTCDKFREPMLAQLPLDDQARLHVTTREIDLCISGLGDDNAAWSTWISYRHKALRFCEAARADQEKAQNILLYQRLTKVMAKLTYGVEVEMQKHMEDLELRVQKAGDAVQGLEPELDRLRAKLTSIEAYVSRDLDHILKKSNDSIHDGLKGAANLQRLLAIMIQTVLDSNSQVAASHEQSVAIVEKRNEDMNSWAMVMANAVASAATLTNSIELSRMDLHDLAQRQEALSANIDHLVGVTDHLSDKYKDHVLAVDEAKNMTEDILETLQGVAESVVVIEEANRSRWSAFSFESGIGAWMPYIFSPVATLLMGSYGLAPSAMRNLGLVALGEVVAFTMSSCHRIGAPWMLRLFGEVHSNTTGTDL